MNKNYFYATIQEEFSLLLQATKLADSEKIKELQETCYHRHKAFCLHLLRDFITPMDREDLYEISFAIFSVFSTLLPLSNMDRDRAEQSVLLLSCDPFRKDETPLRRREDLWDLWGDISGSSASVKACFFALDRLAERLLISAIRNA